ncbi:YgdI/YgdR family lipoprotein [Halomarina salina]|uniref:YgdI/YgdR family lipoprotein n=1 Tax=Halomarina salina TaxID=1872699 RepID=A0ABD5RKR2_9EURY|nr:YgdI/YgdR family lipoprotein [Halomarina salina]
MRPTLRTILAALLLTGMLVVAGCAGPSATNNSTDGAGNGTITTIAPEDTPANDSGAGGEDVASEESDYSLASYDAVG